MVVELIPGTILRVLMRAPKNDTTYSHRDLHMTDANQKKNIDLVESKDSPAVILVVFSQDALT